MVFDSLIWKAVLKLRLAFLLAGILTVHDSLI
jgi:hypothetical protein